MKENETKGKNHEHRWYQWKKEEIKQTNRKKKLWKKENGGRNKTRILKNKTIQVQENKRIQQLNKERYKKELKE